MNRAAALEAASAAGTQRKHFVCVMLSTVVLLLWASGGIVVVVETPPPRQLTSADLPSGGDSAVEHVAGGEPMSFEPAVEWTRPPGVSDSQSLEFAKGTKPLLLWERPKASAELRAKTALWAQPAGGGAGGGGPRKARMACMYAGFMRNWEWMMGTCREMQTTKFCAFPRCRKLFGNQRKHLLNTTDCDVYMSTWSIRGAGRFNTFKYDQSDVLHADRVMRLYERWLFALHIQNYSLYGPIWDRMHRFARSFPQTRPTVAHHSDDPVRATWSGVPVTQRYLRRNDFSQAYKHWCVLQLVERSGIDYDVYFRLRADLRVTRRVSLPVVFQIGNDGGAAGRDGADDVASSLIAPAAVTTGDGPEAKANGVAVRFNVMYNNGTRTRHTVHDRRIHVNHFDVGDFGFIGLPSVIRVLSERIWMYCLADPDPSIPPVEKVQHETIAEYNLMLWRIIFDERWGIDSGQRYLWVSRSNKRCKKKKIERDRARLIDAVDAAARSNLSESSAARASHDDDADD